MADNFNTIAGWALGSAIVALGLGSLSSHYFQADKPHRPHEMGYAIEGVASEGEAAVPFETLLASADVAKGQALFNKCTSCHTITPGGAAGIGPNLNGVVGKDIASAGGFAYSPDLSGHPGNWDFAALNEWLASPKKFASGTKMSFAGMANPEDRANLIAFMNTQGSNLPLPAAPAAGAAPAEGAAADAAKAPEGAAAAAPDAAASAPAEAAKQ